MLNILIAKYSLIDLIKTSLEQSLLKNIHSL